MMEQFKALMADTYIIVFLLMFIRGPYMIGKVKHIFLIGRCITKIEAEVK